VGIHHLFEEQSLMGALFTSPFINSIPLLIGQSLPCRWSDRTAADLPWGRVV
jgi:hypothetical protein